MVYRRRRRVFRRKRRFIPKYTKRKLIKGYLKRKARKGNTAVFKLKYNVQLTTDQMQAGVYGSLLNPEAVVNGTGVYNDWSPLGSLYDNYKICAIKLSMMPEYNVSMYNSTAMAFASSSPIYSCIDYDNLGVTGAVVPSIDDMDEYENCKRFNPYKPWKRYMRVPKYNVNPSKGPTAGVAQPDVNLGKGYYAIRGPTTSTYPSYGVWYLRQYSTTPAETSLYGTLRVTCYMACKNRQ